MLVAPNSGQILGEAGCGTGIQRGGVDELSAEESEREEGRGKREEGSVANRTSRTSRASYAERGRSIPKRQGCGSSARSVPNDQHGKRIINKINKKSENRKTQ